jgi:hypothetical protein
MPRIRTIKPELPHDETLARVSREARYTFLLLLTVSDDKGFFRGHLRYLVGAIYPHDADVTEATLASWLDELVAAGRIRIVVLHDGTPVGCIANFLKHQRIDHPSKSYFHGQLAKDQSAAPPTFTSTLARPSRDPRETLAHGVSESLSPESLSSDTSYPAAPAEKSPDGAVGRLMRTARQSLGHHIGPRDASVFKMLLGPKYRYTEADLDDAVRAVPKLRDGKLGETDSGLRKWILRQPELSARALADRWGSGLVVEQILHLVRTRPTGTRGGGITDVAQTVGRVA